MKQLIFLMSRFGATFYQKNTISTKDYLSDACWYNYKADVSAQLKML